MQTSIFMLVKNKSYIDDLIFYYRLFLISIGSRYFKFNFLYYYNFKKKTNLLLNMIKLDTWKLTKVKFRFYWLVGPQQKVYNKIEIINKNPDHLFTFGFRGHSIKIPRFHCIYIFSRIFGHILCMILTVAIFQ